MKTISITGYPRETLGKKASHALRKQALLPGVLYGKKTTTRHFVLPMEQVLPLVHTPNVYFINLTLGKETHRCILPQNLLQVHPVSDMLLHIDLMCIYEDHPIIMEIPTTYHGKSPGVVKGGMVSIKMRKLKLAALPTEMPDNILIDISKLDLGNSFKVKDLTQGKYRILHPSGMPIVTIDVPRALRSKANEATK